jgi:hypothetical protein
MTAFLAEGRIVPSSRRRTYHQQSDFSLTVGLFLPHYVTSEVMDKGQFDLTHCGIIIQRLNSISADTNRKSVNSLNMGSASVTKFEHIGIHVSWHQKSTG